MKNQITPNPNDLKLIVQDKYSVIAKQDKSANECSCCGCGPEVEIDYTIFSDDYSQKPGYNPDADLGLGCGIPTDYAGILKGHHVLDLGSGAGNDCFVARQMVGENGRVTGLDFTAAMIEKARENLKKTGFRNIEFVQGDIEKMPFSDSSFDVVISNCVLNLVPDKQKAFAEIYRVLKPGGHFCISDVVLEGTLPANLLNEAEMYAGCISGALPREEYMGIIEDRGFSGISIMTEKIVDIPVDILKHYLNADEILEMKEGKKGIISITIRAGKSNAS